MRTITNRTTFRRLHGGRRWRRCIAITATLCAGWAVVSTQVAHAENIYMGIGAVSGSGLNTFDVSTPLSYNFGVTEQGGNAGLVLVQADFTVDRGNTATAPVVFTLYDNLGAAAGSGSVVSTTSIPAETFPRNSSNLVNVSLSAPLSLSAGYYSLGVSTAATGSGADTYGIRTGTLRLTTTSGTTLSGLLFVEDSNTTGTAGTTLQAASGVLAQPVLSTTSVAFGNFRLGATLSQAVTLTNDNLATGNNYSEALAGSVSTTTGGASMSGLPVAGVDELGQGASTSLTVGLPSATAGPVTGALDLSFKSEKGNSDSPGPTYGTGVGTPTINLSGTGYREATAGFSTTAPDLGKFHVGASNVSGTFTLDNTQTADQYSEGLAASEASTTGGASVTSALPSDGSPLAAGSNTSVSVQLASVSAVGANTGTVTLNLDSSGTGTSGLTAASLGSQVVTVSAQGYSGQSIWQTDGSGTWGSFDDWDTPGGTPGVDGSLSVNDTATFGSAATTGTTVSLDGENPALASLTFNNSAASYTISPGTGGSMTVGTSASTGAITVTAGSHSIATGLALARDTSIATPSGTALTLSGAVSGANALAKTGAGTLEITNTGTLSGATTVSGGMLRVNGAVASSDVTVQSGATIAGSGTVGAVTIESGGTLAPGNSPGNLTVTGDAIWQPGGNYNWQVYDADDLNGTAGTDWDLTTITGNLDLTNLSSSSTYNINLWSLSAISPADVDGNAINFDNTQPHSWTIATVGGSIQGFAADLFTINTSATNGTSGFSNDLGGGSLSMDQDGSNLNILFTPTPVPEPTTLGLLLIAGGTAGVSAWRRRRTRKA